MRKPNHLRTVIAILLLLLVASVSCKTLGGFHKNQEDLDLSIKAYNHEFESKMIDRSARFIHPTYRSEYMAKSPEIAKRITIFEAAVLDIKLFNNGVPLAIGSEKDFNRAIVVIRYQMALLPSTKLQTLNIEQEWLLYQGQWVIIPDLKAFLG